MKKQLLLKSMLILTMFLFAFTSCNKDDEGDTSTTGKIVVSTTVEGYGAIPNVNVSLVESASDTYVQEKVTNSEGKVTFENVLPGTYFISCDYIPIASEEHLGESDDFQLIKNQTKSVTVALD